ncbi:MAG: phage minor capsid protein [Clostridia bacterium]|nr:phage minor capsid protein [Clostridia bacterium]
MYDTKQLEELSEVLFSNIEEWENNALTRIGNRVNKVGKLSVADAQALNNLAAVKGDLKIVYRELAEVTGKNIREIEKIYGEAVSATHEGNKFLYDYRNKPFVPFEENKKLQAMVRAFAKSTATEMFNLSKTKMLKTYDPITGNTVSLDKAYKKVLDKAVTEVASGTTDFNSAMRQSLKTLGGNGIRVDYGGGVTRRLDTVVRQNLLWGAKQTFMEYSDIIGEEIGADGIEITAHPFCRPSHEFMQGQQYILGKGRMIDGEYFESADRALEALQDYGCKHHPFSIICGVSVPMHSKEELAELHRRNTEKINIDGVEKTGYEWKQEMRRLETKTRALKGEREILRASGDKEGVKQVNEKMKAIKDKYTKIGEKSGNELRYNRMSVVRQNNNLTKGGSGGIIKEQSRNVATRSMANGLRKPPMHILSDDEIKSLKEDIKAIGADESVFRFNAGRYTGYNDDGDFITVRGDVLPDNRSNHPRDLMSQRAAIAHEYYGHRTYKGTSLPKGSWNDEFRASYMAAKNCPNLSDEDRRYLVLDALERAKESGITIKNNDFIRRILYGY